MAPVHLICARSPGNRLRRSKVFGVLGLVVSTAVLWAASAAAQSEKIRQGDFQGRPAMILSNDRIELTVLPMGGAFARLVLLDDPEKTNPLWDSIRANREAGEATFASGYVGHFVCLDGFGPPSGEESAAGMLAHGEAHSLPWVTRPGGAGSRESTLVQSVQLPRVQELLTRTVSMLPGEQVVYVQATLENLLAFDRPVCWAEHATIGSPFLEPGVTVVDLSPNRAITRPHQTSRARIPHRLASNQEFEWPLAPTVAGGKADLRAAPDPPNSGDHTGHLMDPKNEHAWVTALHPGKRLLLGYVFKTADYPWLQIWEHYPPQGVMARGLEFGTQAFDLPRRQVITQNRLFGELLYRWLPARSTIEASFLMFWARTPEGFQGVDEVRLEGGKLQIRDSRSGQSMSLDASRGL